MKYLDRSAVDLLNNRFLFEEIHQLKSFFIELFSELANEIPSDHLLSVHSASKGVKISKGNELDHCPYQVLDIIRDFDKEGGFNIRLLNWWGRGLFIFVFMGNSNQKVQRDSDFISRMQFHGYLMAKTSSPWDFKKMIDGGHLAPIPSPDRLKIHLEQFNHLQLVKKVIYPDDFHHIKRALKEQVGHILNYYAV